MSGQVFYYTIDDDQRYYAIPYPAHQYYPALELWMIFFDEYLWYGYSHDGKYKGHQYIHVFHDQFFALSAAAPNSLYISSSLGDSMISVRLFLARPSADILLSTGS